MKNYSQHQPVALMEGSDNAGGQSQRIASQHSATHVQDDRYPGSFFRIPGIPAPGKTTWSLVK
ncbi:MAG: hypothetical protein ACXV7J_05495 [Methylomonas sp.]